MEDAKSATGSFKTRLNGLAGFAVKYRLPILGLFFILSVFFQIHFSSIGVWDNFVREKIVPSQNTVLLGHPRPVRADEWNVQTPMFLGQQNCLPPFPLRNPNIRTDGQNVLIGGGAPALDWTLIGKPFNWGFLLFGPGHGLSWYWCLRLFLLLLVSFEMGLILTSGNSFSAFLGALLITFSSAAQWWFSTSLIDMLIFAFGAVCLLNAFLKSQSLPVKAVIGLLMVICINGFVLTLYPSWQVPIAYLGLIFAVFLIVSHLKSGKKLKFADFLILGLAAIVSAAVLIHFYLVSKSDIALVLNTAYPGKRLSLGGGFDLFSLQNYLMDWRLPTKSIQVLNNCEVSTFVSFMPLLLLGFSRWKLSGDKNRWLVLALLVFWAAQLVWLLVPLPPFLAKITLMGFVPAGRLAVITNLTALLIGIWAFPKFLDNREVRLNWMFDVLILLAVGAVFLSSIFKSEMRTFLGTKGILLSMALYLLINAALLFRWKSIFAALVIGSALVAGMVVNPLSQGIGAITNKTLTREILKIRKADPGQLWVNLDSRIYGNYLIALGCRTYNGVNFYPDFKKCLALDPAGKYQDIYNRYAHIVVRLKRTGEPEFVLNYPDQYDILLTPDDLQKKAGVKYILGETGYETNAFRGHSLKRIYTDTLDGLAIYRLE